MGELEEKRDPDGFRIKAEGPYMVDGKTIHEKDWLLVEPNRSVKPGDLVLLPVPYNDGFLPLVRRFEVNNDFFLFKPLRDDDTVISIAGSEKPIFWRISWLYRSTENLKPTLRCVK